MSNINITVMGTPKTVPDDITYKELSLEYEKDFPSSIMAVLDNHEFLGLEGHPEEGSDIKFLDLRHNFAFRTYSNGLALIMVAAVKEIFGNEENAIVEHSLRHNLYCEFKNPEIMPDVTTVNLIEKKMHEIVEKDLPIEKIPTPRREAIRIMERQGMTHTARLFRYSRSQTVLLCKLGDTYDYYYGSTPYSTGSLKKFQLISEGDGFLILLPSDIDPKLIVEYEGLPKMSKMFLDERDWLDSINVRNVSDLNDSLCEGTFPELVYLNEAMHEKKIALIADRILHRRNNVRVVLVAGPSSSGKTTFSNRLAQHLRINGLQARVISLDNYFKDRSEIPVDEAGKQDYENIDALDLDRFNDDLSRLIEGEEVEMPIFNFVTGFREEKGVKMQLGDNELFIIEGIHGLNSQLTRSIPKTKKFKIYISAMTQLNIDEHNRISTSDCRLIRRMVRDNLTRGTNGTDTLAIWSYVVRGEAKNIFPYQEEADAIFNSSTVYELAVLKRYAEALLFKVSDDSPEYFTAQRILKFLDYFVPAPSEFIPKTSIIREFIGGGVYKI